MSAEIPVVSKLRMYQRAAKINELKTARLVKPKLWPAAHTARRSTLLLVAISPANQPANFIYPLQSFTQPFRFKTRPVCRKPPCTKTLLTRGSSYHHGASNFRASVFCGFCRHHHQPAAINLLVQNFSG